MIYRKWSLLTGPAVILGGIVGAVVVVDLLFVEKNAYFKQGQEKPKTSEIRNAE